MDAMGGEYHDDSWEASRSEKKPFWGIVQLHSGY